MALKNAVTAALLHGSEVVLLRSRTPHRTLKPIPKSMTLATLFAGQEDVLARIVQALSDGLSARDVATLEVEPVLGVLEANAGTALDPTYVVYIVEYARDSQ